MTITLTFKLPSLYSVRYLQALVLETVSDILCPDTAGFDIES